MLRELHIRNLALIDDLRLELGPGLNVLTGETGAGKSILIDALQVALGARAGEEELRTGADEASVEAALDVSERPEAQALLAEHGFPHEPDEFLILRRDLLREGKSRAYVNGRLASVAILRALGAAMLDIHGQHQGQALLDPRKHRELLDAFAGLAEEVRGFGEALGGAQRLQRERDDLAVRARDRAQRLDLLEHQRKEIEAARLGEGEEESLVAERGILTNFERLFSAVEAAYQALYAEEGAILGRLAGAAGRLREAARIDDRLALPLEACEAGRLTLEEAARALRDYRESIEFDPARLEAIEARLHEIGKLKRKYGATVGDILAHGRSVARELEELAGSEDRLEGLDGRLLAMAKDLSATAERLSLARAAAARRLGEAILKELADLGLSRARFQVRVASRPPGGGGPLAGLGPHGLDDVEFLISPNPGEELKPLHRIASGGELSRIMLAIRAILARADGTPTLIFDEVDVGIGGAMAETVGRKLALVAGGRQVLCVTHLPQIAALADLHFSVVKRVEDGATRTAIRRLGREERVAELARMLGSTRGRSATPLQHAEEILAGAERWKRRSRTAS